LTGPWTGSLPVSQPPEIAGLLGLHGHEHANEGL
jgi:hypothetical protein